jgi:hypothetical protein
MAEGKTAVLYCLLPLKLTQAVTFIREVSGSNLGRDIDYPEVFPGCPQSIQANAGILP